MLNNFNISTVLGLGGFALTQLSGAGVESKGEGGARKPHNS